MPKKVISVVNQYIENKLCNWFPTSSVRQSLLIFVLFNLLPIRLASNRLLGITTVSDV